jgi:hypothetical protein
MRLFSLALKIFNNVDLEEEAIRLPPASLGWWWHLGNICVALILLMGTRNFCCYKKASKLGITIERLDHKTDDDKLVDERYHHLLTYTLSGQVNVYL